MKATSKQSFKRHQINFNVAEETRYDIQKKALEKRMSIKNFILSSLKMTDNINISQEDVI